MAEWFECDYDFNSHDQRVIAIDRSITGRFVDRLLDHLKKVTRNHEKYDKFICNI